MSGDTKRTVPLGAAGGLLEMRSESTQSGEDMTAPSLSSQARSRIDHWLSKYPAERKQSAVLPALTIAQEEHGGWLSVPLMDEIARYLQMPAIAVYEVASFYSLFDTEPVGRHKVAICTNISCMLRGGDEMVRHVEQRLGVGLGQTTPDGRITLKVEEECLAACRGAPMMTVDGHYYENLTPQRIDEILEGLE